MNEIDFGAILAAALLVAICLFALIGRRKGWLRSKPRKEWSDSDCDHWQW